MEALKLTIELDCSEKNYLSIFLRTQLSNLETIENNILKMEFDATKKILLAYYGKKWNSFRGWNTTAPYHLNEEYRKMSKELLSLYTSRMIISEQKKIVSKIHKTLLLETG